eukprot:TRINITY_DN95091_c0_g1_i1.p1 TRINITY_DN95091_c0_g1~~TRINITY_DN95091_c0_g1_i1.p1  ORF type:complete len:126 (+),score=42.35 TRINITY_DN95091_c0_g1_i1:327-704(+)
MSNDAPHPTSWQRSKAMPKPADHDRDDEPAPKVHQVTDEVFKITYLVLEHVKKKLDEKEKTDKKHEHDMKKRIADVEAEVNELKKSKKKEEEVDKKKEEVGKKDDVVKPIMKKPRGTVGLAVQRS